MTATRRLSGRDDAAVLLLIVVWLSATAWMRPLTLPDEGRYVGVAWEMLRSGDWLTPTLDGLPFLHKPPLFYWLTAAALSLFGLHEWAARIASLLGATAGAFAIYLYVSRCFGTQLARMTLLVLLTQPLFFGGSQFANLDALVAGCIGATILLAASAAEHAHHGQPYRWHLDGAYLCAAAGVLAKGLIGIVLPALVIFIWLALLQRYRAMRLMVWWRGIALFSVVAVPWFIAMQSRHPDFMHYFFVVQHFKRYTQGGFNNVMPFWFYPAALGVLTMPWLAWLYRVCGRAYWSNPEQRPARLLMWVWVIVVVVFFSIPQSKLIGYILPMVPPLSFLIADSAMAVCSASRRAVKVWWASAVLAAVACVGMVVALSLVPLKSARGIAHELKSQRVAGEPVFFVHDYYYDVAFYAGLRQPVYVVEHWDNPDIAKTDNWRKELFEAAKFVPRTTPPTLLIPSQMQGLLCRTLVGWVIIPKLLSAQYPFLAHAREIISNKESTLFRMEMSSPEVANALQCPEKPSGGSAHR